MTSFQIGQHVRLIGTNRTGRVMGLVKYGLQVVMDSSGDWVVQPPEKWELVAVHSHACGEYGLMEVGDAL